MSGGNHWYPEGCGVSIATVDGTLDLSDVTWQAVAPCGCVSGLIVAAVGDEFTVTPEQARERFFESSAERARDREQGFTYRPREHHTACEEAKGECLHDPKWGVPPVPTLDGYLWAAVYALGSRPKYTHLVPALAVEAAKSRDYSAPRTKALCGRGKPEFHWHDEGHATWGKVECKHCIAAATRRLAERVTA